MRSLDRNVLRALFAGEAAPGTPAGAGSDSSALGPLACRLGQDRTKQRHDAFSALYQKEALDLWETAAQWQPTAELHRKMAEMYAQAGDVKLARRHQGLEKFRSGVDALRLNRLEEAHAALDQAVAMLPDHASAWFYFAETCRFLDRPERAKNAYTRCLELHPHHGRALRGLRHVSAPAGE